MGAHDISPRAVCFRQTSSDSADTVPKVRLSRGSNNSADTRSGTGSGTAFRDHAPDHKETSKPLTLDVEERPIDFVFRKTVQRDFGRDGALRMRELLEANADPNRAFQFSANQFGRFANFRGRKRTTTYFGTAVTVAVMRSELEMMRTIVQFNGEVTGPKSCYSFDCGLRKVKMVCPPIFAAANLGDVRALKELFILKANVQEVAKLDGEDNNTVLWSACYHGRDRVVRELLLQIAISKNCDERKHVEISAVHQDNADLSYTPLHIACREGHADIVQQLLDFQANIETKNVFHTALTEAIDLDRQDVVKALVANLADVLSEESCEWLFERKNNMVTISAAAEGLRQVTAVNEKDMDQYVSEKLDTKSLVKFLETPGDAKRHIVQVIFRKRIIGATLPQERRAFCHASVPNGKFNTCTGPPSDFFPVTEAKMRDNLRFQRFMRTLMPGEKYYESKRWEGQATWFSQLEKTKLKGLPPMKVPVDVYQCVIKGIYSNAEVLIALAEADQDSIFQEEGVQAIVTLGWRAVRFRYTIDFWANLLFAVLFIHVAWNLNREEKRNWDMWSWDSLQFSLLFSMFVRNVINEVMQAVGYHYMRKLDSYLLDWGNLVDWLKIGLTGFTLASLFWGEDLVRKGGYPNDPNIFRLCFSITVFLRWLKVLYSMRGYAFAGQILLPVLRAMSVVYPFGMVVIFPMIGFVHAYYVFGVYGQDLLRSFVIMYKVGLVADFDLDEMEDVDPWLRWTNQTHSEDGVELGINDPAHTKWRLYVVIILIAITLMVTVSLMNIFIAVLGQCYNAAFAVQDQIFWRNRTRIVLDEAFKIRLQRDFAHFIIHCCLHRRSPSTVSRESRENMFSRADLVGTPSLPSLTSFRSRFGSIVASEDSGTPPAKSSEKSSLAASLKEAVVRQTSIVSFGGEESEWDYVWFCRPQPISMAASDGEIEDENEQSKALDELKAQMHNLQSNMKDLMREVSSIKEHVIASDHSLRDHSPSSRGRAAWP